MSAEQPAAAALSPADPHQPTHSYTPNQGYDRDTVPPEVRMHRGAPADPSPNDENEEVDYDDIFDGNESAEEWDPASGDLTKNYNRQRGMNAPRSNTQKPSANTFASVDDQVSALSKHAAKIRLDDVKQGEDREKDKADRATSDQVLDQRTRMILLQMINRGVVSEVHGAISTGKEANVYGAVSHDDQGEAIQRAIKVYKTSILVFKDRERYITGEHRFKGGFDKGNNRKMVKLWAEKEYRNLRRIHSAGIPSPEPLSLKLHVLAMSFLGDRKGWAYPRLRDATIEDQDEWRMLYIQLLGLMRKMFQVCRLVHADLSEYNILYHKQTLYIIDVSQSVEPDHPRSLEFLRMDIKNVGDFFRRKGVDTLTDRMIYDFITAADLPTDEPAMGEALEKLYESRPDEGDEDAMQVDNEVFRNQYIPQTLEQVYDVEKDGQKLEKGGGKDLVYSNLLADSVVDKGQEQGQEQEDDSAEGTESDDGAALDSDNSDFDDSTGRPRGKRFEDKDEKKQHKQAVKEAKREKRKEKMPKHLKKKIVSSTSRKKK